MNVMDMDIMRIRSSRKVQNTIQLLAPQSGVITDLNIREGTYLEPYQPMFTIVDLSRAFLDTNGIRQNVSVSIGKVNDNLVEEKILHSNLKEKWLNNLSRLNIASQKGLIEQFDSTIGARTG